jgi:N utilization substance protein A
VKAIIVDVRDPNAQVQPVKGDRSRPSIVISRTDPELIKRLFELEVPEVYDGIVEVKAIARDPGVRAKVAVASYDDRLDPVGACVGPKGSRVRTVVSELRGERVDVVPWSDDPRARVAAALSPARVSNVIIDEERNYATVIVPDDQLSLAIGKEGQNARLAARLTGMHIDIKNESLAADIMREMPKEVEQEVEEGETRCEYVGPTGIRCRNMARPGSHYCGIHEKLVDLDDSSVTDDPDSLI